MKFLQWIQDTVTYLWDGAIRMFKPRDDDYPMTGVQPFEGDPNQAKSH